MKKAILLCALIVFFLMGNTARAETCFVELNGGFGEWKGPCKDGKAYGTGVAYFPNLTYEGPASGGRAHGRAELRFNNGGHARGDFNHGAAHGQFVGEDAEGDRIVGEFRLGDDGKRYLAYLGNDRQVDQTSPAQGAASAREEPVARKCYLENGRESLDWSGTCDKDGKAYGNGKATAPDGMTYTGSAKDGMPDGRGSIRSADGQLLYQGGYKNGFPHGRGTFLDEDGRYYVSDFDNGEPVGDITPVDGVASDESRPETVSDTHDVADEAAPRGEDGEGDLTEDADYDAALNALDGGGRVVHAKTPDDSYGAKLKELEESEKRERIEEALKLEDYFRKKDLEKQRRSEALKAELRKKADAIEAEKIQKWNKLYKPDKKINRKRNLAPVETKRTNWHSLSDSLRNSMQKLEKRVNQIKRQRERQRQKYLREERRREAEWRRRTTPGGGGRRIPLPMAGGGGGGGNTTCRGSWCTGFE